MRNKNLNPKKFSRKGWLPTLLEYLIGFSVSAAIFYFLFLPLIYPPRACASKDSLAKLSLMILIHSQSEIHYEQGNFIESLDKLHNNQVLKKNKVAQQIFPVQKWKVELETEGELMFFSATPVENHLYSYIAATTYDNQSNHYVGVICKAKEPGKLILEKPRFQPSKSILEVRQYASWRCHRAQSRTCYTQNQERDFYDDKQSKHPLRVQVPSSPLLSIS
ncbi:MAG: type IV pilin-like G/H family protein [Cyanobacteria bacterium P01_G01_bin.54]